MLKHHFEVILNTPMGKRQGTMELFNEGGKITGTLCLFQNEEPVSGVIDDQGNCTLHGKFRTLKNQYYFEAEGKICDERLELILCGGKNIYQMQGYPVASKQEKEKSRHPEIAGKDGKRN